jgi:endoglucanase
VGGGFTLTPDGETSFPFEIHDAIYDAMRIDALKFYYTQRSGIEILDSLRPGYARPAGHVGVAPNQGDHDVPCMPDPANPAQRICDYTLDVAGGWYDAGDHGKYVVNGGISAYQLMSNYERTKYASTSNAAVLGDGSLALPESGNGVPDILDEARWELEFLLSMQVPAGKPLAGMAHHKIHDHEWTGLPLLPSNDDKRRELHPPSTAATLNLAATAAQAARLYAPYDVAFAERALTAARTAYAAALANPDRYALVSDGNGGGAYDDLDVSDEFYWAAAELYITTGEGQYRDAVLASPHHTGDTFRAEGFDWKYTGAIGRIELALVPNNLPGRDAVRASVLAAADAYLAAQEASPYGITYAPGNGLFDWGSNNLILNNLVVVATAYDISGDARYRDGVVAGIDYILGRNALAQSYVTGYGEKASENQHSRWYAASLNPALPNPPVGTLSGGPNSSIQDPRAQQFLQGCAPQFCYLDHIDSWSTNELTINWNSTFAWVSGFLADQGAGGAPPAPTGSVSYLQLDQRHGKFVAIVCVTNTSGTAMNGWELRWSYTADQDVQVSALVNGLLRIIGGNVTVTQDGPTVTVTSGKRLRPGQSATFVIHGDADLANVEPELFWLNGVATG